MKTFRCEEQLRQSFQEHARPNVWCRAKEARNVLSVTESTCSDGRADWVWATIPSGRPLSVPREVAALLEQPSCSRILAALKFGSPLAAEPLRKRSGVSRGTFVRHLGRLIDLQLVSDRGKDSYCIGQAFPMPRIEICAFEFKLKNWRRAFQQARRYQTFSHRVYVVMPTRSAGRALQLSESFRRFNIGLISHDADGASKRLILSRKRPPSCPSKLIQAIGLLSRQEVA